MKPTRDFKFLLSFLSLMLIVGVAKATHISGGEISYQHIGGDTYRIVLDVYWDCGATANPPTPASVNANSRITSSCGTSLSRSFTAVDTTEVSQLCAASIGSSECNGGTLPGLQKYTFEDVVVLAPRCTSWTIRYNSRNRDGADNVFQATARSLYVDCILNNVVDSFNSSPIFNADPTPYFCGSTPSTYNFNIADPDGDSISLALVPGKALLANTVVTLQYTGTPNAPHNTNFGGSTPLPNMSFNSGTGSVTFTPPNPPAFPANSSYSYVVVLEARDYDSNGVVKSIVRRDMRFEVVRCTGNNIPVPIQGGVHNVNGGAKVDSNTVKVIEGDSITFDFSFVDSGDTITLSSIVNQTLGASFSSTPDRDTATATIGWRPTTTSGSPFSFSIDALDDNCPVSGRNSATLLIQVIDTMEATGYSEQKQSCNNVADGELTVNFTGGIGPFGYRWFKNGVFDASLTGQTITGLSSNDSYSVTVIDSFNNTTASLGSTNIAQTNPISIATDTVFDIGCGGGCSGEVDITSVVGGSPTGSGPSGYLYSWTGTSDTTNNPTNLCAGRYFVTVSDQNGCDTVYRFYVNGPAEFTAIISDSVDVLCKGDSTGSATVSIDITTCGITDDLCDTLTLDTVGTGSANNAFNGWPAPYGGRRNAKQQYLIRASDVNAAGIPGDIKISSLAFLLQQDNFIIDVENFEINMGCTNLDSLPPDTFITGLFNVFDSTSVAIPPATFTPTWKVHPFQNAFVWDGTSNIIVEVCWNNGSSASLVNSIHRLTNTSYTSSTFFVSNTENACLADSIMGSANRRPNMRFGFCGPEMTYVWSSGGSDSTETGLWAATHTVTVTSEEGCSDTLSVNIDEPAVALVASLASKVNVPCAGDSSGSARITVSGGTSPYTFTWPASVVTGANDSIGTNLTAGVTYVVTVQDFNGCEDTAVVELNELSNVSISITDSVGITCNGDSDGQLFATPDSGISPYSFTWSKIPSGAVTTGATDSIAINLNAGTYRVVVTDSAGCMDSVDAILTDPAVLTSSFTDSTLVGCNGDTSGSLTVTPNGGIPGYTYNWFRLNGTVTTGTSDSIAINLPADTIGVITVDFRGCRDTNVRIMSEPTSLTASFTDSASISCIGGTNGMLTITPSGGTPNYSFNWSPAVTPGSSDSIATGLSGNTMYRVTVTDTNSCTYVDSLSLAEPTNGVTVSFTDSTLITCNGFADGQLIATPTGGTPNYNFSWIKLGGGVVTTGTSDSIAINLSADTYRVIVTDAGGCQDSADMALSEPTAITSTFTDSTSVDCNGNNSGSLTITPTGGTPGYNFSWSPAVTTGVSDSIAINLSGNTTYTVIITDVNGCPDTNSTSLADPTAITSSFTDSSSVSCNGDSDGSVTVTPSGGAPSYTFNWSPAVTTGASDSIATALSGNVTYTVVITDANNCTDTSSISLADPTAVTSVFTDSTSLSCPGDTNGSLTITPAGGAGGFTYAWSASSGGAVATSSADSIAINLTSGVTYTVVITDANSCIDTNSRTLAAPTGSLGVAITDSVSINCFGDANGSLTATPTGGNSPYNFNWSRFGGGTVTTGASDSIAINLSADTFRVIVTDNSGCADSIDYVLYEPSELTSSFTDSTAVSCFGGTNGSLTITPSGGTPNYTYNWVRLNGTVTTGATDSIAVSLPSDTVLVEIIDVSGCRDTNARIVSQPTELTSAFTDSSSVTCDSLGSAIITPSGGTPGYTYTWSPAVTTGATDSIATGLNGSTNYRVIILDNNSCPDTNFISLQDPVRPTAQFTDSTVISCPGDTNGSLTVTPTGGVAPFTYTWSPAVTTGASDSIAINLTSGVLYSVIVEDSIGCTDTVSRTISAPTAVVASIFDSVSVLCAGDTNARLFARATLGSSPYDFDWLQVGSAIPVDTGVSDSIAISLGAGTYRVIVTDANGCKDSTEKQLLDPPTLSAAFTDSTAITCTGPANNGSLTVTPTGGTPGYTFVWTPAVTTGASDSIATGLSAGIRYSVVVTDANGCTTSVADSLSDPSNFAANFTSFTNPTCNGDTDGQLIVTPNQGTAPFTYNWSTGTAGATDSIRTGLSGGVTVFVTVSDNSGCSDTVSTTLTNPLAITSFFSDSIAIVCGGDSTGSLTVTPANGTQPYSFTWTTGVSTGTSDSIAINLAGNFAYSVTITDNLGCSDTNSFTLSEPPAYSVSFTDSSIIQCNGDTNGSLIVTPSAAGSYNYSWSASDGSTVITGTTDSIAVNLRGGVTYTVTVSDGLGCQKTLSRLVSEPTALSLTTSSTLARCGGNQGTATVSPSGGTPGYSFAWDSAGTALGQTTPTATGLFSGLYNVVVTDTNGCTASASNIAVNDFGAPTISLDSIFDASCEGVCDGSIFLSAISFNGPIVSTLWSNGDTTLDITNLCDTTYTVQVTDSSGCQSFYTDTINNSGALGLSFNITPVSCLLTVCDGEVKAIPSGGNGPYNYSWSTSVNDTLDSIVGLCAGTFTTTVTDLNGCQIIDSATIVNPVQITATTSADSVLCDGQSNGVARVNVTAGNAPFAYVWSTSASDTLDSLSGIPAGTYFVTVTSIDGCTHLDTIDIEQPDSITATFNTIPADCGQANGRVTATPSGGNGSYFYQWPVGGATTNSTDTGYTANNYTVTISDQKGCNQTLPFTISNVGGPVITLDSIRNESCVNACDGDINVSVTAGNPPYNYLWTPGGSIAQDLDSVCPGAYSLRVTDQLGCISFYSDTIDSATPIIVNAGVVANASGAGVCDGQANTAATGGTAPYSYSWSTGSNSDTANGLCAGTHYVTVTDSLGCSAIDSVIITELINIVVDSFNIISPTCNVTPCNGEVFVLASGGSGPLTYIWDNGDNGQTTSLRCPGLATVTITDGTDTLVQNYPLSNIGGPVIATGKIDVGCNGDTSGIAFASSSSIVTYLWPAIPSTNDSIFNLGAGTYEVRATDTAGCITTDTIIVNEPNQITASFSQVLPNCLASNGQIIASVSGGAPGYTYLWLDSILNPLIPAQTTDTANNLGAGIYNLQVTDTNGCVRIINVTLSNLNAPLVNLDSLNDESCPGACDGDIFVSTIGGTGSITYSWTGGSITEDLISECPGGYTLQVTDSLGCISFYIDTIDPADPINTSISINSPISGIGLCDGQATVLATGGSGNYGYQWTGGSTSPSSNNLCVGKSYVTVTDQNGCSVIDSVVMANPAVLNLDTAFITNPACNVCNGEIVVVISGGVQPYTYTWDNGDNSDTTSNRCAGVVRLSVRDVNGLTAIFSFALSNNPAPNVTVGADSVSCFASCDGRAYVNILSALPPYIVNWVGTGLNTDTISNLCAGTYGVEVTDVIGCVAARTIDVEAPAEIVASFDITEPNCQTGDGSVKAQVVTVGGKPPYSFEWLDASQNPFSPPETTDSLENITAGVYYLNINDANNCSKLETVTVSNVGSAVVLLDTLENESCVGACDGSIAVTAIGRGNLLFDWNQGAFNTEDISGLCAGPYILEVTDSANCRSYNNFNILPADTYSLSIASITPSSCETTNDGSIDIDVFGVTAPFSYNWSGPSSFSAAVQDVSGLITGDYKVIVSDVNGCQDSLTANIGVATNLTVSAPADTSICGNPGSIFLRANSVSNAAVSFRWFDEPGFVLGSTDLLRVIPQGGETKYIIEATAGLCIAYDTVTVSFEPFVRADAGQDLIITKGDEVNIGGNPTALVNESVQWSPDLYFLGSTNEYNPLVRPDEDVTYVVEVTSSLGCTASDTINVKVNPIKLVDGFTPNDDGVNDLWRLRYLDEFPNATVEVYNRWGQLVYQSNGYAVPWDGRYKGKDLPVGTYYYLIDLNDDSVEERVLTGPVTIMR